MKGKVILRNPIKIDGKEVKELAYDAEKITMDDFFDACDKASKGIASPVSGNTFIEHDHKTHVYLGFYAVVKENDGIAIEDMERIRGFDIIQFTNIGTLFTLGLEGQKEETSEGTSEPTPEDSQSPRTRSAKGA